ncbi:MAG TPA: leucyl aminopeptidase [Chloroflexota bacterium]|nr:leucyl aminopeptidase [Chloroflexota bacterium]
MATINVAVSAQEPAACAVDALVVNIFEDEQVPQSTLAALDQQLHGAISRLVELGEQDGKLYHTAFIPTAGLIAAPRLLLVGSGKRSDFDARRARNVAGAGIRALLRQPVSSVAIWPRSATDGAKLAEPSVEGAILATFDPGEYKTKPRQSRANLSHLTILEPGAKQTSAAESAARRGAVVGEAANFARRLAIAPGNILTPEKLAAAATRAASDDGFAITVLDRAHMAALGMGALLGVAEGSEQPPMTIVMTYKGRGGEGYDVGLVGKGVTFDTGGISIKPAAEMHLMKEDMAGAAATIGAMSAIARLGLRVNVLGVVPAVENMPSGHAMRPGDVVTALNGTTIEVLNTDAEGRMILADAICYAQRQGAKHLVDAATLTGAVVVALGHQATGLLGTPQSWVDQVKSASERAGERLWQLPLFPEYAEQLKSDVADIANVGGRAAGTITGAMFIREFVHDGNCWAHLDIAGTAWTDKEEPYLANGPTGTPLRTFVALAEALQQKEGA